MPYRRLPNTDKARLRALRNAIKKAELQPFDEQVISFKTLREAENFLQIFDNQIELYNHSLENQINANKQYQQVVSNAKMYISHFIQVLNLAVIRGDIKKEQKQLYHLEPDNHNALDLSSDKQILRWGQNIIEGENERIRKGGSPIYNPTIAKVQVHYEVFKEFESNQKLYKATTNRNWEELVKLRKTCDAIILDIWNQVEDYFKTESPFNKLMKCKEYGLVYYYRRNENEILSDD